MRFSAVTLCLALCASNVNGFGVTSPIQRNAAFTTAPAVPHSRGELTKVQMGVQNPPPNETTGIKALGFIGAAGASLALIIASPFSADKGPGIMQTSIPAITKTVSAPAASKSPTDASKKAIQKVATPPANTENMIGAKKTPKKASKALKESGYDLDVSEAVKAEAKAGEAEADKAAAKAAAKKAKEEALKAERIERQKIAAEKAAEKKARAEEAAAKKEEALKEKAEKAAAKKDATDKEKEAAEIEKVKAAEAEADKIAAEEAEKKAVADAKAAERVAAEKEAAEKAAEKLAAEKEAAAAAAEKAAREAEAKEAAAAAAAAEKAKAAASSEGAAVGVVTGNAQGGRVLEAETVDEGVKAFLKNYK